MVDHSPNPISVPIEQASTRKTRTRSPASSSSVSNVDANAIKSRDRDLTPGLVFKDIGSHHVEKTVAGNDVDGSGHTVLSHVSTVNSNPSASSITEHKKQLNDLIKRERFVIGYAHRVIWEIKDSIRNHLKELDNCKEGVTAPSMEERLTKKSWREEVIKNLLELFKQYQNSLSARRTAETYDVKDKHALLECAEKSFQRAIIRHKDRPVRATSNLLRPARALVSILSFFENDLFKKYPELKSGYLENSIYEPLRELDLIVADIIEAQLVVGSDLEIESSSLSSLPEDAHSRMGLDSVLENASQLVFDAGKSGLLSPPASPKEGIYASLEETQGNGTHESKSQVTVETPSTVKRKHAQRGSRGFSPPHFRARSSGPPKGDQEEKSAKGVSFDGRNNALEVSEDAATIVSSLASSQASFYSKSSRSTERERYNPDSSPMHDPNNLNILADSSYVSARSRHSDEAKSTSQRERGRRAIPRSASQDTIRPSELQPLYGSSHLFNSSRGHHERSLSRLPSPPPYSSQLTGDQDNRLVQYSKTPAARTYTFSLQDEIPFWKRWKKDAVKATISVTEHYGTENNKLTK